MDLDIFYRLGLDEREIKLYTGLLKMGPCKAGTLSKLTSIDRSVTYKLLYLLIDKGFVSSVIRENRKYFQATDPSRLQDVLKEREEGLKEVIPFLETLKRETKEEFGINLEVGDVIYSRQYMSTIDPNMEAYFIVSKPSNVTFDDVVPSFEVPEPLFMNLPEYLSLPDVIPRHVERVKEYLIYINRCD